MHPIEFCFGLFKRAAARLNRRFGMSIRRTYLYRLSKSDEWPSSAHSDARVTCELLTPASIRQLEAIGRFDVKAGLKRLERGDRCYVVSVDGRPAHYSWVQRSAHHPITEAGVSVPVGKRDAWIYHCVTADWARGQRIYPVTLQRIVRDCFAEGDRAAWIYTSKQNVASQKGILRAGFGMVATLDAFRVGRRYIHVGRRNTAGDARAKTESARN
jgi:hypothetical protein